MGLGLATVSKGCEQMIKLTLNQGFKATYGGNDTNIGDAMAESFASIAGNLESITEDFLKEAMITGTITYTGACTAGAATGTLAYSGTELSIS